ncbi:unnamed protein product [Effrenium voratum]|nr:unnamed protein product [Effrenium voratum]
MWFHRCTSLLGPVPLCANANARRANSLCLRLPSSVATWNANLLVSHQEYLAKLELIGKRLQTHLRTLKWPPTTHFEAEGVRYALPLRCQEQLLPMLLEEKQEYLAGFFDGDGCVSTLSDLSGCCLMVSQRASASAVLLLFVRCFGGAIYVQRHGSGMIQPGLCWYVSGTKDRFAADRLKAFSQAKHSQLAIAAATWPRCSLLRQEISASLKLLKRVKPTPSHCSSVSWSYVAGFFDAEGCIKVPADYKGVVLEMAQRDSPVLDAICSFLRKEVPQCSSIRVLCIPESHYLLAVCTFDASRVVLTRLLCAGLLVKREAAAQVLTSSSHALLRSNSEIKKGNQSRYRKLDINGCQRAVEIKRLRSRLLYARRSKQESRAYSLQAQVAALKMEHAILSTQCRIEKLRSDVVLVGRLQTN